LAFQADPHFPGDCQVYGPRFRMPRFSGQRIDVDFAVGQVRQYFEIPGQAPAGEHMGKDFGQEAQGFFAHGMKIKTPKRANAGLVPAFILRRLLWAGSGKR